MKAALRHRTVGIAVGLILAAIVVYSLSALELRRASVAISHVSISGTPVTLYRPHAADALPLVVVAHGFGGSRQMMERISIALAKSGHTVAAFDFPGHGRNPVPLSRDVGSIDGTTRQLVDVTRAVAAGTLQQADASAPVSYVGHSMATDVIIRAAEGTEPVGAIGAISMYSDAVTPASPLRLLIVSGASEGHLREVALRAIRQIDANAMEGQTVADGELERRAVVAPRVGHVGVLYSDATLTEVVTWIGARDADAATATAGPPGALPGILLVALVLLGWPLSKLLPKRALTDEAIVTRRTCLLAVSLPALPVFGVLLTVPGGLGPSFGLAPLAAAFAVWGAVQLAVLHYVRRLEIRFDALGNVAVLLWGLGVFALALDRYGAAFLPTGPRLAGMFLFCFGTIPFVLADSYLLRGAPIWRRVVARLAFLVVLGAAMSLAPFELGLSFTVLPVLVLFFLVYGSFARWVANRRGPEGAWVSTGLALAWALAASTPVFAA
ncbi:MAG: alpha/beta fold hydrolase [Pseudomonadota bacterium]